MIRRPGLFAVGLLAGGVAVFTACEASADWPMSRHDAQRTAAAKGNSNITIPMPTWRFPLGGALYYTQQLIEDADGDGVPEFFFVRGSSAIGKRIDDSQTWQTPSMGVNALLALGDLDGNGTPELVITVGTNRVAVVDALTGVVDWTNPATELGARGTVLVGDLTGDGLPEVLLQDCGCCAETGAIPGGVYSFAGNAKSPTLLWKLPYGACGGGNSTTLLDADGDGRTDVLLGRLDGFDLLDGKTGAIKASINHGSYYQVAQCIPARISGVGEQVVCVLSNSTTDDSGHRAFALSYVPGAPSLTVLWDQKLGAFDGALTLKPGLVADLDGDGLLEVVLTAATAPNVWSTYVLDAAGGAVLATLASHKLIATAPVVAGGRSLILTEEGDGFGAWSFKRSPTPAITHLWQLTGNGPLSFRDFALSKRAFPNVGLLTIDLTGDGTPDLIVGDTTGTLRVLDASQGTAAPPPIAGTLPTPPWGDRLWAARTTIGGKPALVTEWSDGAFRMHAIVNGTLTEVAPPGVHFGGLYNIGYWRSQEGIPTVGSLGPGQPDSVIVLDATRTIHVLDASKADAMTPPKERWSQPNASSAIVVPNIAGGAPGVAMLQRQPNVSNPAKSQVVAFNGDGQPLWTSKLDGLGASDLLAGNIDGDNVPDVVASFSLFNESPANIHTRAIAGASGATIWDGQPYPDGLMSGASLNDWDNDRRDDLYSQGAGLYVLSGATGAKISPPPAEGAQNAMPMLVDVDGDGKAEVVLQGGYARVTVISSDLSTVLYKSDEVQSTIQYGALARCPSGPRLVESTYFYHTSRLTLTDLGPPQIGNTTTLYLAGGQRFSDEAAAIASGTFLGVLTAVNIHENLTGLGHPSAVVGSDDGWLYAIDPCTGNLDFAYEFKDAVGAVVFGDTDGDGLDEMIVEVSDGYVYGMKQKVDNMGGSGGMTTTSSTTSSTSVGGGGVGGAATGGAATGGEGGGVTRPDTFLLYGRACTCSVPGDREHTHLGVLFAGAVTAAAALRRRRRAPRA